MVVVVVVLGFEVVVVGFVLVVVTFEVEVVGGGVVEPVPHALTVKIIAARQSPVFIRRRGSYLLGTQLPVSLAVGVPEP